MDLLPTVASPGVAERAEALADAACELHDVVSAPSSWSADAVEDAVESMETTALALTAAHPEAAAVMLDIGRRLAQFRERLDLPPGQHTAVGTDEDGHQEQPVAPTPLRLQRARRALGPGYKGIQIPQGRTASGR